MVKCVTCKRFNFENIGGVDGDGAVPTKMAVLGLGLCDFDLPSKAKHRSALFERKCDKYVATGKKLAEARIAWLADQ